MLFSSAITAKVIRRFKSIWRSFSRRMAPITIMHEPHGIGFHLTGSASQQFLDENEKEKTYDNPAEVRCRQLRGRSSAQSTKACGRAEVVLRLRNLRCRHLRLGCSCAPCSRAEDTSAAAGSWWQ